MSKEQEEIKELLEDWKHLQAKLKEAEEGKTHFKNRYMYMCKREKILESKLKEAEEKNKELKELLESSIENPKP